jgi:hypothetical protein
VLVHDVKCQVDKATAARHPECIQDDGTAITAYFTKFEEFNNWSACLAPCHPGVIVYRYDIDTLGFGALTPNHPLCLSHRLLEVKCDIFTDLKRIHHRK